MMNFGEKMRIVIIVPLFLVASVGLLSCAGSSNQPTAIAGHNALAEGAQPASLAGVAYRLGSGDKIKLSVYSEKDLSGEFVVGGDGAVSLPLVGQVRAGGLTVAEFEKQLVKKLKKYVRNPRVSTQVLNFRPFYIQGEVKAGGEYPYSNGLVVRDAVAKAGGYTYRAVTGYVLIRHANQTVERRYSLDAPVHVLPGDNIRVTERIF